MTGNNQSHRHLILLRNLHMYCDIVDNIFGGEMLQHTIRGKKEMVYVRKQGTARHLLTCDIL